jgi:hypothetical protein
MQRNIGSTERYVRVAAGLAAAAAATQTSGWKRTAFAALSAGGLTTGVSGYCPLNQITGRVSFHDTWPLDQGLSDSGLRRHKAMHGALGSMPTGGSGQVHMTPASEVFSTP